MFRRIAIVLLAVLALLPIAALATPAAMPMVDSDSKPREGVDYVVLSEQQPTFGHGKIEVAEVFSYACIHCAQFQPLVDAWLLKLPKDVRYEYVPSAFGAVWENFARAYFAAKLLGVQERTHGAVFKAVHFEHTVKSPKPEDIADWYGDHGVDRGKFLTAMSSPQVDAMVAHSKEFVASTGVEYTPTIVVAGKYRVMVNADRGFEGLLATVDYLLKQELATGTKHGRKKP